MSMLRQVRKALNDIDASFTAGDSMRAEYQFQLLRKMIDDDRRRPWSDWMQMAIEEFDL